MSETCKWLHEELEQLPLMGFPVTFEQLPHNGVYFFYETDEIWGHNGHLLRIVRIGTHKDGNFGSRIAEHYLVDESKMQFDPTKPAPKDRSIFRKNIGRALLKRNKDPYLEVWEIDFVKRASRHKLSHLRNIAKEQAIEREITRLLRRKFRFRFIVMDVRVARMGTEGIESKLIGTVSRCKACRASSNWLGNHSPKLPIQESGLWLIQHLRSEGMTEDDKRSFIQALTSTREWLRATVR